VLPWIFAIVMLLSAILAATYARRSATPPDQQAHPVADLSTPAPAGQESKPGVRPAPPVRVILRSPYETRRD
jgi:hypothetical protein